MADVSGDENRPVLAGLLALVGVAVAVGLVAALAVMAGTHMLGLTGGGAAVAGDAGATLYVAKPKKRISLQAGQPMVAPMARIDLTGTYPGGEGAVLNVQKFSNGSWQDFYSISATVTNGTFSTYIQTGTPGVNRFRVTDSDTHLSSNQVRVTIQ